ncbi:MAG: hypothetical protein AABZ06_11640 [Bdellovibrionota bacterium]
MYKGINKLLNLICLIVVTSLTLCELTSHLFFAKAFAKQKKTLERYSALEEPDAVQEVLHNKQKTDSVNAKYDVVPQDQVEVLIKRIKVVEALILRHGRAYDYKTLTLKELNDIQKELSESP